MNLEPNILSALEKGNYEVLEKWIGEDKEKAKIIFRYHKSLATIKETHQAIKEIVGPLSEPKTGKSVKEKINDKLKSISIVLKEKGLQLVSGNNLLAPKYSYAHRGGTALEEKKATEDKRNEQSQTSEFTELDFKDFLITYYENEFNIYFKSFVKSLEITQEGKSILSYYNKKNLNVSLKEGDYTLSVNKDLFHLNLLKE